MLSPISRPEGRKMRGIFLESISKTYRDGTRAVHEVTLTIPPAQIMSLVGPSGSGKSTLLHIIAGLLTPSTGQVFFGEREVTQLPAEQRNVGMVFQSYLLFPH
ncbi:MAG: ATP-binding cassette domain-containing protein, partial [Nitrospinota bacterium]